jgi:hypothetical protein
MAAVLLAALERRRSRQNVAVTWPMKVTLGTSNLAGGDRHRSARACSPLGSLVREPLGCPGPVDALLFEADPSAEAVRDQVVV